VARSTTLTSHTTRPQRRSSVPERGISERYVRGIVPPRWRRRLSRAAGVVRAPFFRGLERYCPICEQHFRTFLPAGVPRRPDVRCPRCGSRERHRLLWLYLRVRTEIFTSRRRLRLLHVAPEPFLARRLARLPTLDYVSGDLSGEGMLRFDLTRLPFEDDSFDVILCLHVLEHVPDDTQALSELARVLRGWAILQVPIVGERTVEDPQMTDPDERLRRFGQEDHVRTYGRDYQSRLRAAGFELEVVDFARQLSDEVVSLCRLNRDEDIYVVRPAGRSPRRLGGVRDL
jgi:SAM-dependent methyltransferase